ncbi:MAG TPA: primosomal protein N' [candidate division Zixibacteria bacterium]|nr:primosomal protein N' [candidate division Zixibacteria bacterium]
MALALPGLEPLTYSLPADMASRAAPGLRAEVPVGRRMMVGVITELRERTHRLCRPLSSILDDQPVLDDHLLWLTQWVSRNYLCGWGQAIWAALPPGLNRRQRRTVALAGGAEDCGDCSGIEAGILGLLKGRGPVSISWLSGKIGSEAGAALVGLERRGMITSGLEWSGGRDRARAGRWLVWSGAENCLKLPPARARLWDQLRQRGEIPSAEIKSAAAASWLAANGLARWERRELRDIPAAPAMEPEPEVLALSGEQQEAVDGISRGLEQAQFGASLVFGITASGKTEVYIRAAKRALESGRRVLVLVPEIGLVSQMASRLSRHFPQLGLWHSELSDGERYDVWRAAREGRLPLVLGVRSAVFAPLENLGLVVVDEEHDASYKQQDTDPLYHAREVALARAGRLGAQVILGSATPSVESYHRAKSGAYRMYLLGRRIGKSVPPRVELIDCRTPGSQAGILSERLAEAVRDKVSSGGQVMLLLNRRGFARALQCRRCGAFIRCRNCDISLTFHRDQDQVLCHYCGFRRRPPAVCPACGSEGLQARGGGVQRLEQDLGQLLPGTGLLRMDSDTTGRKGSHGRILSSFQRGESRLLIGTQMIAKGHHFPGVSLVGILNIDDILSLPDFRSAERAAQLLVQMSGRAGRGAEPGLVLVQTRLPNDRALGCRDLSAYRELLEGELEQRLPAGYPPYKQIALITVSAGSAASAGQKAGEVARLLAARHPEVEALGPAPAPIPRLRGRHRFQILLKHERLEPLLAAGRAVGRGDRTAAVRVDVDPASTL